MSLSFNKYQERAKETAIFPKDLGLSYLALGLGGEAGEIQEKVKKILRDKGGQPTEEDKFEIVKEIGDILWYAAMLSDHLGYEFGFSAKTNMEKLRSRKDRGVLGGSGDNR